MKIKGYNITPKTIVNIALGALERLFTYRYLNLGKTLYINFRCLPFSQAIKFPIVIWGGVKICSLMGKIVINSPIKRAMIELGSRAHNEFVGVVKSRLFIDGSLVFEGKNRLMNGYQISIQRGATLSFGEDCYMGENVSITAKGEIFIGSSSRIAYNSVIINTDIHYSINTQERTIYRNLAPIRIGCFNWIGNGSRIMKGAATPNWTIVTAGSFLNKDYTQNIPEKSIIGGSPAKLIKEGQCRVFSVENEMYLDRYFEDNQSSKYFVLPDNVNILEFCKR